MGVCHQLLENGELLDSVKVDEGVAIVFETCPPKLEELRKLDEEVHTNEELKLLFVVAPRLESALLDFCALPQSAVRCLPWEALSLPQRYRGVRVEYGAGRWELPEILSDDPVCVLAGGRIGDVLEIQRKRDVSCFAENDDWETVRHRLVAHCKRTRRS